MQTLDPDDTADADRGRARDRLFVPILLGVLCGLRRGEVAALRWRSVDLDAGTLAVVASTEQTYAGRQGEGNQERQGPRRRPAGSVLHELRQHRIRQAETLLLLGVRLTGDHHVAAREDGEPLQPRSSPMLS